MDGKWIYWKGGKGKTHQYCLVQIWNQFGEAKPSLSGVKLEIHHWHVFTLLQENISVKVSYYTKRKN